MLRLLTEIKGNGTLQSLNLAYNQLLEEQSEVLTREQIEAGQSEVQLTPFNSEVVHCFKDLIKYNVYLLHLNL